jgi:hypothetical protein
MWIPLSLLKSGKVPIIVLNEWIQTLGYKSIQELKQPIHYVIIEKNKELANVQLTDNIKKIQFINPTTSWKKKELEKVWSILYETLQSSTKLIELVEKYPSFTLGWPTYQSMISNDPIFPLTMIYSYCYHKNIYIPVNSTNDEFLSIIKMYQWSSKGITSGMEKALLALIYNNPSSWMNVWNFLSNNNNSTTTNIDLSLLKKLYHSKFERHLFSIEKITPTSSMECILFSAMHFGVDISKSSDPTQEYTTLCLSIQDHVGKNRSSIWGKINYTNPVDKKLQEWVQKHPNCINLSYIFNPIFPIDIYPQESIQLLCIMDGKNMSTETQAMTNEQYMSEVYSKYTYMAGFPYSSLNSITPIYREDVSKLSNDNVISYGSDKDGWTIYTWAELYDYFESVREFKDPSDSNIMLSKYSIYKLKIVSKRYYRLLYELLLVIEEEITQSNSYTHKFIIWYHKLPSSNKINIQNQLWAIMALCMVIRTEWTLHPSDIFDRTKSFTLKEYPVNDQIKIDLLVTDWLAYMDNIPLCKELLDLPLMNYVDGQYTTSKTTEQGLTIGKRLDIVKDGSTIHSCLRVSSNWLLSSLCYYMNKLSLPIAFNISSMERIS